MVTKNSLSYTLFYDEENILQIIVSHIPWKKKTPKENKN